jgi:hypothetical protein
LMTVPDILLPSSFCGNQGNAESLTSIITIWVGSTRGVWGVLECLCFWHNYIVNEPIVWKI